MQKVRTWEGEKGRRGDVPTFFVSHLLTLFTSHLLRFIGQEQVREPAGQFQGHLSEGLSVSGAGGELHRQGRAVIVVVALQGLDEQVVDGKPDRPAPVGVAAEQTAARHARPILDPVFLAPHPDGEGRSWWNLETERMPNGDRNSFSSSM
jgi:hypothetical protein